MDDAAMLSTQSATNGTRTPTTHWLLLAVVVGLLTFALSPAFFRSHLEGFTYLTETMSLMPSDVAATDPLYAVGHSYFYMSRPGIIWLMAPLSQLSPGAGYTMLMWLAMPFFLCGVVVLTKLWSGTSWLASLATLLFMPVVLDTQAFHNDNIVATAFSLWGLILLTLSKRAWVAVLAGCLMSIALLCRLDQILLLPFFLFLTALGQPSLLSAATRVLAFVAGAVAMHVAMFVLDPAAANLIMRIEVVSGADALWSRGDRPLQELFVRDLAAWLLAFGVGLPALWLGAKLWKRRLVSGFLEGLLAPAFLMPLAVAVYPIAIYVLTFGKYYDPRGFLTVVPFLAPIIALALQVWVLNTLMPLVGKTGGHRPRNHAVVGIILAALLVPGVPPLSSLRLAPHETENAINTLTGRIWYTQNWRDLQETFHGLEARAHTFGATVREASPDAVILSTTWNEDRAIENVLAVLGYTPQMSNGETCTMYTTFWSDADGNRVRHLRAHVPFLINPLRNTAAVLLTEGEACLRSVPEEHRYTFWSFDGEASTRPQSAGMGIYHLPDAALDTLMAHMQTLVLPDGSFSAEATARHSLSEARDMLN